MPYVPSEKTLPPAEDRKVLDKAVEPVARKAAGEINNNLSLIKVYKETFMKVTRNLRRLLLKCKNLLDNGSESELAQAIYEVGEKYGYEGAFLGEFNYSFTRFIQRVPQIMVENGIWKEESRYWLYAATVEALTFAEDETKNFGIGVSGVFEDIKDEYKRRVNTAYEAAQIIKSGDCYDTPYYTRLVKVIDEDGNFIGYQEVMLKRSPETLDKDVLDTCVVLKKSF
jgi:hypothetical protein